MGGAQPPHFQDSQASSGDRGYLQSLACGSRRRDTRSGSGLGPKSPTFSFKTSSLSLWEPGPLLPDCGKPPKAFAFPLSHAQPRVGCLWDGHLCSPWSLLGTQAAGWAPDSRSCYNPG